MLNTAAKVQIARAVAATLLGLGLDPQRRIRRQGISFQVDIREGIDLSLFLFGSFQRHVTDVIQRLVAIDGVVIDVGANVGAVTLPIAAHLTAGRVFAFEPTDFAFGKLLRNLDLNPALSRRITPVKLFAGDRVAATSEFVAYSSWPVTGDGTGVRHPIHQGVSKNASCGQTTLDEFVSVQKLSSVSLIKIDTDGHEFAVLSGAAKCLADHRPLVVFEACGYLMMPPAPTFDDFAQFFAARDYIICDGQRLTPIGAEDFARRCPPGGGLDLVAVPAERHASSAPAAMSTKDRR